MAEKIIQNAAYDPESGVYYNSVHVHDYVGFNHNGSQHFIDGGHEYLRRSFSNNSGDNNIVDWSLYEYDSRDLILRRYLWGTRENGEIKWVPLYNCETNHLKAILRTQKNISVFLRELIEEILNFRSKIA